MQRLIAGALLADGVSEIHNISQSDDCTSALLLCSQLGGEIEVGENAVRIKGTAGKISPRAKELTPGESGLAARLFTPIAALTASELTMIAEKSLQGRPMSQYESVFSSLGGSIHTTDGSFPLAINGPLQGGTFKLDGKLSSQFLTGLLTALPSAPSDSSIEVVDLASKPYIELTLEVLADFGIEINASDDLSHFAFRGNQSFAPIQTVVDGDWSGAAALAVAGMLCAESSLQISGLDNQYTQADEAIRGALLFAGGALSGTEDGIQVARRPVRPFRLDLTESPDLFPVMAALAAHGKKPSRLIGIHRLIHKETNRAEAIQEEWAKMGIRVELDPDTDTMIVHPQPKGFSSEVALDSHGDHRMVMALVILGLAGDSPVNIERVDCIAKSYPEFFDDLDALGARMQIQTLD
jgi:3-phosphoshikimate 1-carboxyvinyltransferase